MWYNNLKIYERKQPMERCPKCNGTVVLWKDAYDRFDHFYECQKCKRRFWMITNYELTKFENHFVDGFIKNKE